MRITTKKGDRGNTRLYGGRPVSKCDTRIKAQGALDELISFLGLAKAMIKDAAAKRKIDLIQRDLFKITGCISAGRKRSSRLSIEDCDIRMLEDFGDIIEGRTRMPSGFVIPGATAPSAVLHVARTVTRRAECCVVELNRRFKVDPNILVYLNRLSDLLFVLAIREERRSLHGG